MSGERGDLRTFWPQEEDVVPIASGTDRGPQLER